MKYTIYKEPDYFLEGLSILEGLFNNGLVKDEMHKSIEKHGGAITEDDLRPIFENALILEEYVLKNIDFALPGYEANGREIAEFLYTKREHTDNIPAAAFYFYDRIFSSGSQAKILAIIAYAIEDYFIANDLEDNPPDITTDADLFKLLDAECRDATDKYDALRLYYMFDAYHAYNEALIERITCLIKDKLNIFTQQIDRLRDYVEAGIIKSGAGFLHEAFGVGIEDEPEHEIRPFLYNAKSMMVSSSRLAGSRINIGTCIFDMLDIVKKARTLADTVAEFLKLLSDNTKFSILQMIKTQSCYGGQIAERLGLTNATISYHMAALHKLELVFINKENTKIYYTLNTEKILRYLDGLRTLLT